MSVLELKKACAELPPEEQVLFAALIAADQVSKSPEFKAKIEAAQESMDRGKRWRHEDVIQLHEQLKNQDL